MYVPKHFRIHNLKTIKQFISRNPFALIASVNQGIPVASHLLTELQEDAHNNLVLNAHMAKSNPLWNSFDPKIEILTVFQGAHTYISPTWYQVQAVPTWNYLAVHAYGFPRIIDDNSELYQHLERIVERQERANEPTCQYRLKSLPTDFIANMMDAVVGFQVVITKIEASFKLSQNRSGDDYQRIIIELRKRSDEGSNAVADAMERYRPERKDPKR